MHELNQVYKFHEKWIFVYEAKRIEVKYQDLEVDPDHGIFPEVLIDPKLTYDQKMGDLSKKITGSIDVIKDDKSISFEDVTNVIPVCSNRMMGSLILLVDRVWPSKGNDARHLVEQEIKRRGADGEIYATSRRGYLLSNNGELVYRELTLKQLIENNSMGK